MRFRALRTVGRLLRRHHQHAVHAEVFDTFPYCRFDTVENGEHDDDRERTEDDADEREGGAQRMRFHFFETRANGLTDLHGYSVLNASIGFKRDARIAGYMP